jgi:eukaryotic-like serine/threonine-protein kinase
MSAATATKISDGGEDLERAVNSRVGTVLNKRWRLDTVLGVGGMGAVYAATHRNGNRVAIKVLHARHCGDEILARRLEQETCVANSVDHPGVVRIFDDGRTDDGAIFLIMELLDGEGLHTRLARKTWQVSPGEALGITWGILDVLAAAHRQQIVHCDIKPENVFITRRGEIKLLDFGVAGIFVASRTGTADHLFGTPGYMAPEQAMGHAEQVDARTDLWAVGATLFRMLTGRVVHQAASLIEQLVDAGTRPAPAFATVVPGVDPVLATLMDRALAFDKAARFSDAAQMQESVRACALSGAWGAVGRDAGDSVELSPLLLVPERSDRPPLDLAAREPTLRISRWRARGSRKVLVVLGGAAMAAASFTGVFDPRPWTPSTQDDAAELALAGGPTDGIIFPEPRAAIAGQRLIKLTPLAPPTAAAPPAHVGRRPRALRRSRPALSVAADDDVWGRRH